MFVSLSSRMNATHLIFSIGFSRATGLRSCAGNAEEALSKLATAKVDIVVSDIGLPDVDGYDLMQRLRELPAREGGALPAIALTAYGRSEDRTQSSTPATRRPCRSAVEPAELAATTASFADFIDGQRKIS